MINRNKRVQTFKCSLLLWGSILASFKIGAERHLVMPLSTIYFLKNTLLNGRPLFGASVHWQTGRLNVARTMLALASEVVLRTDQ